MKVSESKREAIERYDDKTYKRYSIRLRIDDDKEIIRAFEKAKRDGKPYRELLQEKF
ncbi:MAG: hypothetical protein PUK21_01590 [Peptostreptococcaceae bacterium]|nr:hypothetical protein [Peptostreptococcaceae bacterium]MDY5738702.1 hypothetical protein [Anaerovoracaceae bacterium]